MTECKKIDVEINICFTSGFQVTDIDAYWFQDQCNRSPVAVSDSKEFPDGESGGNRLYTFYKCVKSKLIIVGSQRLYWANSPKHSYIEESVALEEFLREFERAEREYAPGSGSYEYLCFKKNSILPDGWEWNYW